MSYENEAYGHLDDTQTTEAPAAGEGSLDAAVAQSQSQQTQQAAVSGAGDEAAAQAAIAATQSETIETTTALAASGAGAGTAQAAAEDARTVRAAQTQQSEQASRDGMRTVQDMQGMEVLMFLFALLLGLGNNREGIGSDAGLRQLAGAFGANEDQFVSTIRGYQDGDRSPASAIRTARSIRGSINVDEADLAAARATIAEHGGDDNPILTLIAQSEHKGNYDAENGNYNVVYGGDEVPLTTMTINEVIAWQRNFTNNGSPSSAAGEFQIIRTTLTGLRDEMGLTGNELFDPEMQDRMGYQLLTRRGYDEYLSGEMDESTFMRNLSMEWASFPKDENGASYYAGDGLNNALTSPASVLAAMRMAREDNLNPDRPGSFAGDPSIRERYDVQLASLGGAGMDIASYRTNNATNRAHMTAVHQEAVSRSPVYDEVIDEVSAELPHLAPHLHRFEVDGRLVIDREYAARLDGFIGEVEARGGRVESAEYNMVNVLDYRLEVGGRRDGVLLNTPHLVGRAWDGKATGISESEVEAIANSYGLGARTPGSYAGTGFTHLDISMTDRRYAAAYSDPMVVERPEEEQLLASLPNSTETPEATSSYDEAGITTPASATGDDLAPTEATAAVSLSAEFGAPDEPQGVDQTAVAATEAETAPEEVVLAANTTVSTPRLGGTTAV